MLNRNDTTESTCNSLSNNAIFNQDEQEERRTSTTHTHGEHSQAYRFLLTIVMHIRPFRTLPLCTILGRETRETMTINAHYPFMMMIHKYRQQVLHVPPPLSLAQSIWRFTSSLLHYKTPRSIRTTCPSSLLAICAFAPATLVPSPHIASHHIIADTTNFQRLLSSLLSPPPSSLSPGVCSALFQTHNPPAY